MRKQRKGSGISMHLICVCIMEYGVFSVKHRMSELMALHCILHFE